VEAGVYHSGKCGPGDGWGGSSWRGGGRCCYHGGPRQSLARGEAEMLNRGAKEAAFGVSARVLRDRQPECEPTTPHLNLLSPRHTCPAGVERGHLLA
jgi:hypothetical protein